MARNAWKAASRQRHNNRPIQSSAKPETDHSSSSSSSRSDLSVKKSNIVVTGEDPDQQVRRVTFMAKSNLERSMLQLGALAILSVTPLPSTHNHNKFTLYALHIQNALTGRSWLVYRRYSDFLKFRAMLLTHFSYLREDLPVMSDWLEEVYFPRKHSLRSKSDKVVQHRAQAFLEFCQEVHGIMVRSEYFSRHDLNEAGLSILRGFLGSSSVTNYVHYEYSFPVAVPQYMIIPSERAPVGHCGALTTVMEETNEERWLAEEEEDEEEEQAFFALKGKDDNEYDDDDERNSGITTDSSSFEEDRAGSWRFDLKSLHDKQSNCTVLEDSRYDHEDDEREPVMELCVDFEESDLIIL